MNNYVLCINNEAAPASLTIGKVYPMLSDSYASKRGMIRILDDTLGEAGSEGGYLYPLSAFVNIEIPTAAMQALEGAYG